MMKTGKPDSRQREAVNTALSQLSELTAACRAAIEADDLERLGELAAGRQALMDQIDAIRAAGESLTDADRQLLSSIAAADREMVAAAEVLLNQYRDELKAVRNFRSVKAYIGEVPASSQYLDVRQ